MSEASDGVHKELSTSGLESLVSEFDDPADVFDETPRVSLDSLFRALANPGRRYVLTYVLLRDEFVSLSEVVDFVMRVRQEGDSQGRFRSELVTELVETHLPALAEAGLIDYRIERQFVGPTDSTAAALPYLYLALEQVQTVELEDE